MILRYYWWSIRFMPKCFHMLGATNHCHFYMQWSLQNQLSLKKKQKHCAGQLFGFAGQWAYLTGGQIAQQPVWFSADSDTRPAEPEASARGQLEPLQQPLHLSLEERLSNAAMDIFKTQLAPVDHGSDSRLQAFGRAASVDEALHNCDQQLDPSSLSPVQLCWVILCLCDQHLSSQLAAGAEDQLPSSWLNQPGFQQLVTALGQCADRLDDLQLICAVSCLVRLGVSASDVTVYQLTTALLSRVPELSLPGLTALSVFCHIQSAWPRRLVAPFLHALQHHQHSLSTWQQLSWLVTAMTCAKQFMSEERLLKFEQFLYDFVSTTPATAADADSLLNVIEAMVRREVVEDATLPVLRPLIALYLRAVRDPPAAALSLLGHGVWVMAEASPAVEGVLMERAARLVQAGGGQPALWRMMLSHSQWQHPDTLRSTVQVALQRQLASLGTRLAEGGGGPLVPFNELHWTLVLALQEPTKDRLERVCHLCLAFLDQPSLPASTMERTVRYLARKYLRSGRWPADGWAGLLERALCQRLCVQLRCTDQPVIAADQVARQGAFVAAFCQRQIPADVQNRLLSLAHRDQLTPARAADISQAVKQGRRRWMRGRGALSANYLHQLNALTIALNRWTMRNVGHCHSIRSTVRLAEAVVSRRGAVIGNTSALDAVVTRFNQLMLEERVRQGALVSSAVDRLASCLASVRYRDDETLRHMCRHIVRRRECISRKAAMNVLQYAFSTGYWPPPEDAEFEQFLSATAEVLSRFLHATPSFFVLRACQSLCLYGQLPVHLARSVLSQAFLDKTQAEITRWEGRAAEDGGEEVHRGPAIRRFQMEVNRTIRLNMPDQNLPWFSGDYAKGLPDRRPTARHSQLLSEVGETAARLAGSPRLVRSRVRTEGYHFTADVVLLRNSDGTYTDRDQPTVESVALLVPSTSDYCINTPRLCGSQLLRKLHLEMLGFTVRVVDPHHWNSMALADDADKLKFLAALIDGTNLLEAPS